MSVSLDITLTKAQLERTWQLTMALAQNDASQRRSLDMLFIHAARFVARIDSAGEGQDVLLDSGKGEHGKKIMYTLRVT